MTSELQDNFKVGDVISIAGLYADGTKERDETPRSAYANKPEQRWRVTYVGLIGVRLVPILPDGTLDVSNALGAEYWILSHAIPHSS
jgi:hypothetical protein